MKPKILIVALLTISISNLYGQGSADALRFSQTFNGGTARFVGMGGAFGALGGDFGSLNFNPAGLGVYRSSEFSITPSFKSRSVNSTYNGTSMEDSRTRFYFDNVGFVMSFKPNKSDGNGLVGFNLGFGYNRTNDFYSNSIANGVNDQNSILDYYAGLANRDGLDNNTLAGWAWDGYLIDTLPMAEGGDYVAMLNNGDIVEQQHSISKSGTFGEYVISFGTNFSNKFYLGATIGIQNFNLTFSESYKEYADEGNGVTDNDYRFYEMEYLNTFETSGTGYNFKVGAIYKPIESLRIGLALHTPTYFDFTDTFSSSLFSDIDSASVPISYLFESPSGRYDYKFESPFKVIGSLAYVFKDVGLISLDYEYLDYSAMRFREGEDGDDFTNENLDISDSFKEVSNIRVGGEVKLGDMFLRAGYAYYGSPYKSGTLNEKASYSIVSGGVGYRSGNFFIDAAYMRTLAKEKYIFYDLRDNANNIVVNPVSTEMSEGKFLVTLGFKF